MTKDEIRSLRHSLTLSRADFGRQVGVSKKTVESWEQGLRKPSGAALLLLRQLNKGEGK